MKKLLILPMLAFATGFAQAQALRPSPVAFPYSHRLTVQTGLLQDIVLKGQNLVVAYTTNRLVFDWSHGHSLNTKSGDHASINQVYNDRHLNVRTPWSTGPSIGYRLTPYLNVRAEFKAHQYEVSQDGSSEVLARYRTCTVGAGVFYEWYPFRHRSTGLQGLVIEPVVRYWANVSDNLDANSTFQDHTTGTQVPLSPYKVGLLGNLNIGYTFGGK